MCMCVLRVLCMLCCAVLRREAGEKEKEKEGEEKEKDTRVRRGSRENKTPT